MANPFILLPIEIKVREFHAKLLLSCFAAEAGFHVILGDQVEFQRHLNSFPRGIYIDKSIAKTKTSSFKRNIKLGNRVVAWCEEGLIFLDPESYIRERISVDSFKLVDIFFAWGDVQAEIIKNKVHENGEKIFVTGNPRLDLLRNPYRGIFAAGAKRIRDSHGPFILINTNFSLYNHFYGRDFVTNTMKAQGRIKDKADEDFYVKWADYLGRMYHHFLDMVRYLSLTFSNHTFIIRPHPSENHGTWENFSVDFSNVHVIHKGNAIEWIMASDVLIHNGCTTGVEAFVLGKPVLCYCPITSETYDSILPNALSDRCSSLDDLRIQLESTLTGDKDKRGISAGLQERISLFEQYAVNARGPAASENITAALHDLAAKYPYLHNPRVSSFYKVMRRSLNNRAVSLKYVLRKFLRAGDGLNAYVQQKFPGLDIEEIQESINLLNRLTNRFSSLAVQPVRGTNSCFMIFRKS